DFEPVVPLESEASHTMPSPLGSPLSSLTDSPESSRPPSPLHLYPTPPTPGKGGNHSQTKMRKLRSKKTRKLHRQLEKANAPYGGYQIRSKAKAHHVFSAKAVRADLETRKL